MDLYVIRRKSAWGSLQELEAIGAKSAKIGNDEMPDRVRWIRSYVVKEPDGRFGSVCIYQAKDLLMRFFRWSIPSSSATTQPRQAKPPENATGRKSAFAAINFVAAQSTFGGAFQAKSIT